MAGWLERVRRLLGATRRDPPPTAPGEGRRAALPGPVLLAHPVPLAPARPSGGEAAGGPAPRFRLAVDDAGETLIVRGDRLTLGHLRAGQADLAFLADVGPLHAELVRSESLREGSVWRIRPGRGEVVKIDGREVSAEGALLHAGARVTLGLNLAFRVAVPDDASRTILLVLEGAAECAGARTVALFGDGEGAALRIGPGERRHVCVPGLEHEISLVLRGGRLLVRCEAGVGRPREARADVFLLSFPPPERVDLLVGPGRGSRPPFALTLFPVDSPRGGPGGGGR
ncbi:MAG: hypothetical protein AB1726_06180 [Planctomycetota bacterium]